ncbi:MAG: ABC transporter substrate-binding protein [Actinomycetia bacterium]|nr:ABC transporter substrate-binding protein [Actinomycetes bacterium]
MTSLRGRVVVAAAVACLAVAGCHAGPSSAPSASALNADGCISAFDAAQDYFPDKATFSKASNITVEYHRSYKVVTVKQPAPGASAETYVLVHCGAPAPTLEGDLEEAQKITVPVKRVAAASTTQVPAFELANRVDALAGVGNAEMISDGPTKDAIAAGKIQGLQSDGMSVSVESVAGVKPDLFVTSGTSDPAHAKIRELGIPVVADAEWLETSPLGRSEWIKLQALFLNAEATINPVFDKIVKDYTEVAAKAAAATGAKPTVLAGAMYQGEFNAASEDGYVGALIRDAGATNALAAETSGQGSTKLGLEVVLAKGSSAQFWINSNLGGPSATLAAVTQADPRLAELQAVKDGSVWDYSKRVNASGGNDYWQNGVVRPDLVLADLVAIFHPEVLPNHQFTYYEQIKR